VATARRQGVKTTGRVFVRRRPGSGWLCGRRGAGAGPLPMRAPSGGEHRDARPKADPDGGVPGWTAGLLAASKDGQATATFPRAVRAPLPLGVVVWGDLRDGLTPNEAGVLGRSAAPEAAWRLPIDDGACAVGVGQGSDRLQGGVGRGLGSGRESLLCLVAAVGASGELQDHGVVDQAVDRRRGGHGIAEDAVPLAEHQVRGDQQ
jgi:hypothetical protein